MAELADFAALVGREHGLAVVSTLHADGTIHASVVNAGVLDHPLTGRPVVGFVVRGAARKLVHLRTRPQATVTLRVGWEWAAVQGTVDLIGPDDPAEGFDPTRLPGLLRDVFTAAGGGHEDWDTYDRVMAEERRAAVLVTPQRVYANR